MGTFLRFAAMATLAFCLAPNAPGESGNPSTDQEDLRTVRSPDGNIEFQVFVGQPVAEGTALLPRLAYRVLYRGKPMVDTSFLGFEMREQNPVGEKPGLTSSQTGSASDAGGAYSWLISHFLQNGSQGRLYDIEARAYNSGVAFRYLIPWSAPMENILLVDENTEFQLGSKARSTEGPISELDVKREFPLPFVAEQPGQGWLRISQSGTAQSAGKPVPYAPVTLQHDTSSIQGPTMVTRLAPSKEKPWMALESKPVFATPWRVLAIAPSREALTAPLQ